MRTFFGYVLVKVLIDVVINNNKRKKLSTILGCKQRDKITLYILVRRGSVIPNYDDYLVITEESLVIPQMLRCAEELSISITTSQTTKEEEIYEGRTTSWFIGGYLVHNYVHKFFVDM